MQTCASVDYETAVFAGNALKYFLAAQVAMFGVFHPEVEALSGWRVFCRG
jgi:hypothetical protein